MRYPRGHIRFARVTGWSSALLRLSWKPIFACFGASSVCEIAPKDQGIRREPPMITTAAGKLWAGDNNDRALPGSL